MAAIPWTSGGSPRAGCSSWAGRRASTTASCTSRPISRPIWRAEMRTICRSWTRPTPTPRKGLDLPEEPDARRMEPDPACVADPIRRLDLAEAGITSIVWATGYALDFGWLKVDAFDGKGRPVHRRGVSEVPGLYFLGLSWLSRRASAFIWGVWHDAKYLAGHIAARR